MYTHPMDSRKAFTLLELIVVLAVVAALLATVFPAMTKTNPAVSAYQCLNNSRQLSVAWRMYADDNHDHLIYCAEDNASNTGSQYSWVKGYMDFDPSNPGNWDVNHTLGNSPFFPYTGRNPAIYKCPSDRSTIIINGAPRPRIRTMTMNVYLGGFDNGTSSAAYYHYLGEVNGRLNTPGPARLWVFLEIRPDWIDYASFGVDMSGYSPSNPSLYRLVDLPGFYHNQGCNFSFADGHGETRKWVDQRTTPPLGSTGGGGFYIATPRNADVGWLQDHSTRPK